MSYRVCVPTAGTGSRLGPLTRYVNKALVSIANRPTLSHIIDQFPSDVEFVIALGHKGNLVKEFLDLAYPERSFFFTEVLPFEGPGSGLGYSLLCCKEFLQQPFVFISCDTLVRESIPEPASNWMGYAEITGLAPYRTLDVQSDRVADISEKGIGQSPTHKAYIGLAGIADYDIFWQAMRSGGEFAIQEGEAHGMRALLQMKVRAVPYVWFDTGTPEALERTREAYRKMGSPNILEKENEAIWFVNRNVIKFSDDTKFIANRVKRVQELIGYVPKVNENRPHMYRYPMVNGTILSAAVTLPLFQELLTRSREFWKIYSLDVSSRRKFSESCMRFYRDKTIERVNLFYANFHRKDGTESINAEKMPAISELFDSLDWNWLADGLPGRFHGDFHFENILWSEDEEKFTFLDWRQDFGGSLKIGDIYYDLAKLMHGLIVCHELIAKDQFAVKWDENEIRYDLNRKQILVECERAFESWLKNENYDLRKVRVITALIFLNIAALHHFPYSLLLYVFGKKMLKNEMQKI